MVRLDCPAEKRYFDADSKTCVEQCPSGLYTDMSAAGGVYSLLCAANCSQYKQNHNDSNATECVPRCSGNYSYADENSKFCIKECKLGNYYVDEATGTKVCVPNCFGNYTYRLSSKNGDLTVCAARCPNSKAYHFENNTCTDTCGEMNFSINGTCAYNCKNLYYRKDEYNKVARCTEEKCLWSKETEYGYECIRALNAGAITALYVFIISIIVIAIFVTIAEYLYTVYGIRLCPCFCRRTRN